MQVFRELTIRGEPEQISATVQAICDSVSGDWSRDTTTEAKLDANLFSLVRTYCFDRAAGNGWPAAALFLARKDLTRLYVTNIIPLAPGSLGFLAFNAILEEFYDRFVAPAASKTGARAALTEPEADLERWLSPEAAKKLRSFSMVANKRTGASHPADKKLWYDFVVSAYRSRSALDPSTLARWLYEAGGWDEEWADKLAIQYEQARGLLEYAEHQAVGA